MQPSSLVRRKIKSKAGTQDPTSAKDTEATDKIRNKVIDDTDWISSDEEDK